MDNIRYDTRQELPKMCYVICIKSHTLSCGYKTFLDM